MTMFTYLKNLFSSLARFKAATILNVLGLTVAFASFLTIMMQVKYDLAFDKGYATAGKLYQVDVQPDLNGKYVKYVSRPMAELLGASSHLIKGTAFRDYTPDQYAAFDPDKGAATATMNPSLIVSETFPEVFGLDILQGDISSFGLPEKAILPRSIARKIFGDENPVGRPLSLSNTAFPSRSVEVVGVYRDLPVNSSIPNCIMLSVGEQNRNSWEESRFCVYVLIDTPEEAREAAIQIPRILRERDPERFDRPSTEVIQLNNLNERYFSPFNSNHKKGNLNTVYSLIAVAVLIVLVAMINFINFSLALVPRRIRNINTRKVLGSSTLSLRLHQLCEALILTALALGVSLGIVSSLATSSFASLLDADMSFRYNMPLVWITCGVALLTAVLASLYPAFYSTSFAPAMVLKGSFGLSSSGRRLRTALIGFQYVVSIALIIVALFIRVQYEYMRKFDIGLNRDNIVITELPPGIQERQSAITDKLKQNPDIVDVAYSSGSITDAGSYWSLRYKSNERIMVNFFPVTSNFPSLLGIEIVQGRDFDKNDELKPGSYIFNQSAQEKFDIEVGSLLANHNNEVKATVVGIAKNFNFKPLHYSIEPMGLYISGSEEMWDFPYTYIKIQGHDPGAVLKYIRNTLLEFDPDARNLLKVEFLDEAFGQLYLKEKHLASLITLFSLLAVLISTVGAFGLVMFETQYRRKEIGVRKVFGATVKDVLALFNKRYIYIVGVCFLIAGPAAYYIVVQWLGNFTYKAPVSVWIFGFALMIVLMITVTTVTLQSYRAATENPAHSVHAE